ncbi:hypothetical protein M501DRAFT_967289 [Patellaria atrata CBS 101060]|uniref:RING-CH-type domain-containing protein n=1 Tax=Patellaria atrata CBS 101060 TaxID=1346257 RepID=A0A9P4SJ52_9PEZI|nr:hypothetical protein M501DRAFT_967289 [Patellaria atrata CBS 101060]
MASIPPRPASQRRSSPPQDTSQSQASSLPRTDSVALSTISEDSQTLLLNPHSPSTPEWSFQDTSSEPAVPAPVSPTEDSEPRKCWICFSDETEDTPTSSEWRNPCPCALTAHESCLLDWVADLELSNTRRRTGPRGEIQCPQCKSEIKVERPRSVAVHVIRLIEHTAKLLVVPTLAVGAGTMLIQGSFMHGVGTIYAVFGFKDGYQILRPLYDVQHIRTGAIGSYLRSGAFFNNVRLHMNLVTIPPILIASRTKLADSILPVLPLLFFATSSRTEDHINLDRWPPSAALAFSVLPYVRTAYNAYYDKVWAPHERRWLKEIQPRAGQNDEGEPVDPNAVNDIQEIGEDEAVFEINVDLNVGWDDGDEAEEEQNEMDRVAHPFNAPPEDDAAPAPHIPRRPAPQARPAVERQEGNTILSLTKMADTTVGALIFPYLAAAVGDVLRLSLPSALVKPPLQRLGWGKTGEGKPTGLLQTRWGRTLVGGCLFVVVKDALMLYVRWRMARNQRLRQIVDWQGERRKGVGQVAR